MNKWTVPGPSTTSQVRSLRKVNNDQVAIAIDTERDSSRLEDEDDDKGNPALIQSLPIFHCPSFELCHMVHQIRYLCT